MKGKMDMKRKVVRKRLLCAMLSGVMAATVLIGCGGGENKEKEGTVSEKNTLVAEQAKKYADVTDIREITEGVKLTIAVPQNARVLDYNTSHQTRMIEETLGVDLEFITLPMADYASKLNVMVMGGEELPDMIFNPVGWEKWIDENVLYDLSDFYANPVFAANIKAGSERADLDCEALLTRPDGGIYCVPQLSQEIYTPVYQKMWVYQPWLDALGEKVPETTEDYYRICKKVVATDLNGNGKQDEIGITGTGLDCWFDCIMSSFVYAHEASWRVVEDGKVSFAYTTDAWKEGLKYIHRFFEEGLIPRETLSQSVDQYRALQYKDTPVLFSFGDWCYTGTNLDRRREYTVVPALEGPQGAKYSCNVPVMPSAGAVITTDCKNPLAAFLVCDYMCSKEMSLTQRYGQRGVDWDFWEEALPKVGGDASQFVPTFEGYDIAFYPYDMINFWNSNVAQSKCYRMTGPMMLDVTLTAGAGVWVGAADKVTRENAELEVLTAEYALACYEDQPKEVYDHAPLTNEESDEVADIKSALSNYVNEATCAFLSGEKDIDAEWDGYLKELENIGYKEYLEVLQRAYDRVH